MRFKCTVAYDGTDFNGWQSQPGGNTIQDILEARLQHVLNKQTRIHGSGRTDAGVHAHGQVFHFDADWAHGPEKLHRAFFSNIPKTIQVTSVKVVSDDFHSRFSAKGKCYQYRLFMGNALPQDIRYVWSLGSRQPDIVKMQDAAAALLGQHDFSAFSAKRGDASDETLNPVRNLYRLDVKKRGRHITLTAEADGFLYKMVRTLTGAALAAGLGTVAVKDIKDMLASGEKTKNIQVAPAEGLSLKKVHY